MRLNLPIVISVALPALFAQPALLENAGSAKDPAIAADGRSVAFVADRDGSGIEHIWVRPLAGDGPRQLTTGKHNDREPAFSPDGRTLAYVNEANGGGIYLIPAAGGKPRLFAQGGLRPRFSPDGRRIAYWVAGDSGSRLFEGDVAGRKKRPLHAGFHSAKDPVWSPDGKRMIFAGCKTPSSESCDWWVSEGGGEAAAIGAARIFREHHMDGQPSPDLWLSTGNTIVFTAKMGENTRLWTLRMSADPWRAEGSARRLTAGEQDERTPAAGSDGRILYASRAENIDIWSLPLDADDAAPRGPLERLTSDASIDQRPSLSRDGKRIAWETSRGGNFEVWVKDLVSGRERGITSGPLREHMPALSPDGSKLVYDAHDGEKVTIFESAFEGGETVRISEENVGQGSFQWTEQGDTVLHFHRAPPGTVGLMDLAGRKRTLLLRHSKFNLSIADARLSPDGNWIAFPVPFAPHRLRLAVARVSAEAIDSEQSWTYVAPETINTSQPEWSPNGRWLYFLSDRTGRLAVWAQRLSGEKKPEGAPKAILQFPDASLTIAEMRPRDIGLTLARDKLALAAAKYSWAIWSVRP
ncbi:MAG: PD40 domain-containing protein [Bryobacterales bacterium]|nr:PD40 domain-containing protein [Bryobacterales bacterium]